MEVFKFQLNSTLWFSVTTQTAHDKETRKIAICTILKSLHGYGNREKDDKVDEREGGTGWAIHLSISLLFPCGNSIIQKIPAY